MSHATETRLRRTALRLELRAWLAAHEHMVDRARLGNIDEVADAFEDREDFYKQAKRKGQ